MSALMAHAKAAEAYAKAFEKTGDRCAKSKTTLSEAAMCMAIAVSCDLAARIMRQQIAAELNPTPEVVAKIDYPLQREP